MIYYYGEYLDGQRWNGVGKELKYESDGFDSYNTFLLEYEYLNGNRIDFSIRVAI